MVDSGLPGKGMEIVGNVGGLAGGALTAVGPLLDWCKYAVDVRGTVHWDSK